MSLAGGPIRLGDRTSGGGQVISASGTLFIIDDLPLALAGDKATCNKHGGIQTFVECCQSNSSDGKGWIIEGCKLSCGCFAFSSCASSFWVEDTVSTTSGSGGLTNITWLGASTTISPEEPNRNDHQFQILSRHGKPLVNATYRIATASGSEMTGVTDSRGMTQRIATSAAELLHIYLVRES
ncbi:PAAR domain-containing protein [Dyella sp. C11]|uniref:PAAR domain-containing protein n=1 Tax=Dyella sp. C11 TaxID=2126991 RepID=UPI001300B450|nr:PAAR domain-containing protein [Dyella sp. C11]